MVWLLFAQILPHFSTAIEGNIGKIQKINLLHEMYVNIREQSVRFLVRKHYHTLKNLTVRQTIQKFMSTYYDTVYQYSKLTDEERDFIDNISGLFM